MALWLGLWGVHRAIPSRDETPSPKIHSQGKTEAKAVGSCCLPACLYLLPALRTASPNVPSIGLGQGWRSSA